MSPQELHNITTVINALVAMKWSLICMAICLCGIFLHLLLKEQPAWWRSFSKKKKKVQKKKLSSLEKMKQDLRNAERPRGDD